MKPGDLIEVMQHNISGYGWTCGQIGSIIGPAHTRLVSKDWGIKSPIWPCMWVVQVENPKAKGGYALAALPEKYLGPHNCTTRCPDHFGIRGESCAI